MTRESLKLPAWAVPILLSAIVSASIAYAQLAGKEDSSVHAADVSRVQKDHTADVVTLQNAIRDVENRAQNQRDVDFVRDSAWKAADAAWKAEVMRILKANR